MLIVIPQICLQCGETTGEKSVQAEIQTPSTANGYTIGFGKFTFTFCDIEHFMIWVTDLLNIQAERAKVARDAMMSESIFRTTTSVGADGDWTKADSDA